MSELASNSDIENLYYTDSNFLITASNASNPSNLFTTDLFKSLLLTKKLPISPTTMYWTATIFALSSMILLIY